MSMVMVRYRTKPEFSAENQRLVEAVFAELHREAPAGLRYATFKAEDGVSFVHLASSQNSDASPLQALDAFKAFTAQIRERCDEIPTVTQITEVGSYRLFDG